MRLRRRLSVLAIALAAATSAACSAPHEGRAQPRTGVTSTERAASALTETAAYVPRSGPMLQRPGGRSIRDTIVDNIKNTRASQTIRVVLWNFDDKAIADALIDAKNRRVRVQMLMWWKTGCGPEYQSEQTKRVKNALQASFRCIDHSARGADGTGELHQKSFTFSRVGDTPYVSLVGSYNPTRSANAEQYNVAFQFVNNETVHGHLKDLFEQQWPDKPVPCDERLVQHFFDGYGIMAYPFDCSLGDPVLTRLRSFRDGRGKVIRVATSGLTKARAQRIARELARLDEDDAVVKVLHSDATGDEVRTILENGGVETLDTRACGDQPADDSSFNHAKMLLFSWVGTNGKRVYRSWVGSDNLAEGSMYNDELMVQVPQKAHYDKFVSYFEDTWSREDNC